MKIIPPLRLPLLRLSCLALFLIFGVNASMAQSLPNSDLIGKHRNIVSLELMGNGFIYSLNYERILFDFDRLVTTAQIGVSYYPPSTGVIELWVPMSLNQLFRVKPKHYLELGIGQVLFGEDLFPEESDNVTIVNGNTDLGIDWIFRAGYRFQSDTSRWVFKAAFTPFYLNGWEFIPWGSLGVGFKF